jgi:hypothetical protein
MTRRPRTRAQKVAIGYLVFQIAVFVGVAVALALHSGPDASLAPVFAIVSTLPTSLVVLALPDLTAPWDAITTSAVLVAAALLQAWLLYRVFDKE